MKFAPYLKGNIINVSGWKDIDKEGKKYADYFKNAETYTISNYKAELKGIQGYENEIFLDLTAELDKSLIKKYDVVFNHTTLEHIYKVKDAFKNLCLLSKNIVIIVVPFLQQVHGSYDDYWRFSPSVIKKLFEENGLSLIYLSFNNHKKASIYIFAIGSRNPDKEKEIFNAEFTNKYENYNMDEFQNCIGCRAINNSYFFKLKRKIMKVIRKCKNKIIN